MAIASNFPAIKPSLMLDFANTKRLDSRVTFTRTTTATYYDGVTTAMAEQNLLLQSQNYATSWTVTNLTPVTGKTAPDSTSTATEFTAGAANAVLTQGYTAIAGSYTFSVWLRRVTGTGNIDIAADNGTWTTKVITGTWARYDVTQTVAAGSKTAGIRVVTSGDAIEVWGAQLEQRSSVSSYTATTTQAITNYIPVLLTAASGVPRFDHNPTTDESLGLLIEEARTNLLTYSAQFDNAAWTKSNSSITANTIVAPDGTLTGDQLVENTSTGQHRVYRSVSGTTNTNPYTYSLFAKASTRTRVYIGLLEGATFVRSGNAIFDLSTGTIVFVDPGSNGASGGSATIQSVGNGWYRCTYTLTLGGTDTSIFGDINLVSTGTTISYTGNGYSGLFLWGAQLEEGAFPTSYIPTVAATVTRNADAASMTGPNFSSWYSAAEGTVYVEAQTAATNGGFMTLQDGSVANYMRLNRNSSNSKLQVLIESSSGVQANIASVANVTVNTFVKGTLSYKFNDAAVCLNSESAVTDTSVVLPSTPTELNIGFGKYLTYANGTIKKLAYYPLRLTNANLQALTS